MKKRFELIRDMHGEEIRDVEHQDRFLILATTGFGTPSVSLALAERVVDFLNSLPPEQTLLYPHNIKAGSK